MHKVIIGRTGWPRLNLSEVWAYRELLGFLAWRDVTIRYKQTYIGAGWAFIRPFLTMFVFTVIFGKVAKLPSEGVPYAVLTFTALLPWQFFSTAYADAAGSIVGNGHMVTKIYFPRLVLPMSALAVGVVDFLVSLIFLFMIMAFYRIAPSPRILAMPLFLLLAAVFTLGLSLWFAALFVKYRDVRHFIPFITQFGLFVSPVAFSSSVIPQRWRLLYALNPMVAVIDGFRWSVFGAKVLYPAGIVAAVVISIVMLVTGLFYFKSSERSFADLM